MDNAHAFLSALLEQLPYAAVLFDQLGQCCFANARYQVLTSQPWEGLSHLEIARQWGLDLPLTESLETVVLSPTQTYPGTIEWRHLNSPGNSPSIGHLLCFLPPSSSHTAKATDPTLEDLQSNQLATMKHFKALQDAKDETEQVSEFLTSVIHFLPNPVFVKDAQHRFMVLNDACCRLIGQPRETLLGKSDYDFFPKEEADIFWAKDDQVLNSSSINENEEFLTDAEGHQHYIITRKASFTYRHGQRALVGVIMDLTEQRRLIHELIKAKELAEEANRAKSEFLAKMSHELRTPLNSVIGFTHQLLKNKQHNLHATDIHFLQRIEENGIHLLGLINEVLDLSRIESGILEVCHQPLILSEFLPNILSPFEFQAQEKALQLELKIPSDLAAISTDREKLRQIMNNLLSNALKFTHSGSVILEVIAHPESHKVLAIEVKDTGIGIAPDKQAIVFEAFRQEDDSIQRRFGGTGLGLTIARHLCEMLGYQLEMESVPQQGSVFRIRIQPTQSN